jgi:hypothetical protein
VLGAFMSDSHAGGRRQYNSAALEHAASSWELHFKPPAWRQETAVLVVGLGHGGCGGSAGSTQGSDLHLKLVIRLLVNWSGQGMWPWIVCPGLLGLAHGSPVKTMLIACCKPTSMHATTRFRWLVLTFKCQVQGSAPRISRGPHAYGHMHSPEVNGHNWLQTTYRTSCVPHPRNFGSAECASLLGPCSLVARHCWHTSACFVIATIHHPVGILTPSLFCRPLPRPLRPPPSPARLWDDLKNAK